MMVIIDLKDLSKVSLYLLRNGGQKATQGLDFLELHYIIADLLHTLCHGTILNVIIACIIRYI